MNFGTQLRVDSRITARRLGRLSRDERGFTLVEVVLSIVILGIVGAAATNLVIRLTKPREEIVEYEQVSLAARMAAETIWELFSTESLDKLLNEWCAPSGEGTPADNHFHNLYETVSEGEGGQQVSNVKYKFAFRCSKPPGSDPASKLYQVYVWLKRTSDGKDIAQFPMLARLGGYLEP